MAPITQLDSGCNAARQSNDKIMEDNRMINKNVIEVKYMGQRIQTAAATTCVNVGMITSDNEVIKFFAESLEVFVKNLNKRVQRNSGNQTKCQLHCVCINIVADGQWRALIGKRKAINRPKTALLRNSKWTATTSTIATTTTTCCQWSLVKQQHV
uniref:Uncharacterized protein n=1 Tax=Glossina pallidipes TaxID=7398 RepID=A0A1A9ZJ39_GLOPL